MPDRASSLVRSLAVRVALLAAIAAGGGALGGAWIAATASGAARSVAIEVGTLVIATVLAIVGAALARRWMHQRIVAPLAGVARDPATDEPLPNEPTGALPTELMAVDARFARLAERLRAEQAQRARVEKLATVGHMAAGIAHEVGNPLAAIAGYAHVLRTRAASADSDEVFDALERECDRIDRIVRGLLDYARPRRVTPTAVSVNAILAGVRQLLADQGVLRRVAVHVDLDADEPTAFGERHELEQVFVNLLLNAADAMERIGQVVLRTRIVAIEELRTNRGRASDAPGEYAPHRPNRRVAEWLAGAAHAPRMVVHVVVADSGPGVPAEDSERVFDPFYTTKHPGQGTGLGLALVARIVDALGGAVWVQRAREGGAAFVIVLPLAGGHRRTRQARAAGDASNDSTPRAMD